MADYTLKYKGTDCELVKEYRPHALAPKMAVWRCAEGGVVIIPAEKAYIKESLRSRLEKLGFTIE